MIYSISSWYTVRCVLMADVVYSTLYTEHVCVPEAY